MISRIAQTQERFDALVNSIPAKFYFPIQHHEFLKFGQNMKNKAPKQLVKEASKKAKKLKVFRFNIA
jgi:hypothetical protein